MTLKKHAQRLHEQGFRVIPCGMPGERPPAWFIKQHGGKVDESIEAWPKAPRIRWLEYQDKEPTDDEVDHWWSRWPDANIALLTGVEFYAVDADSQLAIDWVEKNLTFTPWRVDTGKGRHYYYGTSHKGLSLRNKVRVSAKIDIRGKGGYVIGPGSIHHSGREYVLNIAGGGAFCCDDYTDLPDITPEDIEKIEAYTLHRKRLDEATSDATASLTPSNPQAAGFLMDMRPFDVTEPVGEFQEEGARDSECTRLAGSLIGQGFSVEDVAAKCLEWNEHNVPPLEYDTVIKCVESIARGHEHRHGKPVQLAAPPPPVPIESMLFTFGELSSSPPEQPEQFMGDRLLFDQSRIMIAGAPKIGKSRFALSLGVQLCCAGQFMDRPITRPLRVMWMQAEIHKAYLMERVLSVSKGLSSAQMNQVKANLVLSGRLDLDLMNSERDFQAVRKALSDYRPDIWIVDPIINFSTAEENSNVEVQALLRRINQLAREAECAVILIHHAKKQGKNTTPDFDDIRGASAFRGWFDTGILLTGKPEEPMVMWESRNGPSPGSHIAIFDQDKGEYRAKYLDVEQPSESDPARQMADLYHGTAYELLERSGSKMSFRQLIDAIEHQCPGVTPDVSRRIVGEMLKKTNAEYVPGGPDSEPYYYIPKATER